VNLSLPKYKNYYCLAILLAWVVSGGCLPTGPTGADAYVWGRKGLDDGRFFKPRAITIDDQDRLYIVDKTGRIQVFDRDGNFIRGWRIPEVYSGKPIGLSISHDDLLIVCDTHYFRLLFYTPEGELIHSRTIGGKNGREPGEFGFITDVVQDSDHNCEIGGHGEALGQFLRPQGLAMDENNHLWVADACNHRIQIFDANVEPPKLLSHWGEAGREVGQLNYPYAIELLDDGNVMLCEFGNDRVGTAGKQPGQFSQPWAIAIDSKNMIHILDTYNHRIQRFVFSNQKQTSSNSTKEDHAR